MLKPPPPPGTRCVARLRRGQELALLLSNCSYTSLTIARLVSHSPRALPIAKATAGGLTSREPWEPNPFLAGIWASPYRLLGGRN
jgi:hypothetical protein